MVEAVVDLEVVAKAEARLAVAEGVAAPLDVADLVLPAVGGSGPQAAASPVAVVVDSRQEEVVADDEATRH